MMPTKEYLLELSGLDGVAGREDAVRARLGELLAPYGAVEATPLGSLLCTVRKAGEGEPHMLLDAHMDEIGMMVAAVDQESGFLRVGACGGVDRRVLAASPVTIYTQDGPAAGVVCSVPPHLSGDGKKSNAKVEDIWIDAGLSPEEAKARIFPGDVVTVQSTGRELLNGQVSGKALDDRAGCVALLKALELLKDEELGCGLTVLFSSMEEVGGQGAKTAAYRVNPTHAIAVDVSFAYTPDAQRHKCGDLGKGPMVGFAPILNRKMSGDFVRLAGEKGIPFQREVMGGNTGTNADAIAVCRRGVVTGLLSIPQKYMHTSIEVVAVEDVENTGKLIAAYIRDMWGVK